MGIETYNQNLDKYSRLGCVGYGIGHIILFKFGIFITNNSLLKFLAYFEKLGVWSSTSGAVFSIFYNRFVQEVNMKLNIKLKVVESNVYKLLKNDTGTRGLGIIKYHSFGKLIEDGVFTQNEVDEFIKKDGVGHHIVWDGSKGGYLINTNGTRPIKCDIPTLQYMYEKGMIRKTIRTIEPDNEKTKKILNLTLFMMKAENKGKLKDFLEINKNNPNLLLAKEYFYYGR